jgi:hypothetical protein
MLELLTVDFFSFFAASIYIRWQIQPGNFSYFPNLGMGFLLPLRMNAW